MIRESKKLRVPFFGALLVVLMSSSLLDGHIAYAGDADGVQGYSMKLKNKDFTTNDGAGPGVSGLIVGSTTLSKAQPQAPDLTAASWLPPRVGLLAQYEFSWLWMMFGNR